MAITSQRDDARRCVVVTLTGSLSFQERRFIETGTPASGYDLLVDLRGADLRLVTSNDAHALAGLAASRFPAGSHGRVAILATDDANYGTARMYATHREASGLNSRVFRSREEADAWFDLKS